VQVIADELGARIEGLAGLTLTHSSGIPALRNPAKYVASKSARIFGTP
jgi:hypothetical protein